jgi:hypothetical protein
MTFDCLDDERPLLAEALLSINTRCAAPIVGTRHANWQQADKERDYSGGNTEGCAVDCGHFADRARLAVMAGMMAV